MLGPGLADAQGLGHADAVHAREFVRLLLDDIENARSEGCDEPLRDSGSDAFQEAGAKKALQILRRGRRRGHQLARAELNPMVAVMQPPAARLDDLADGNR